MLLTLSLLVVAPAHAYRDQVLLYDGNSAPSDWGDGSLTDLDSALTAAGARSVDQASTWPSKLDNYVLVVLFLSQSSYSEAQRDDLQSVVDAGGGIVLVTDNDDFVPYTEGIFNTLLSYMGADSRFDDYQVIGNRTGDCSELSATIDDELTVGQPDLQYALGVQADPGGVDIPPRHQIVHRTEHVARVQRAERGHLTSRRPVPPEVDDQGVEARVHHQLGLRQQRVARIAIAVQQNDGGAPRLCQLSAGRRDRGHPQRPDGHAIARGELHRLGREQLLGEKRKVTRG